MICGVGCDIIEVERIRGAVGKCSFVKQVFTAAEQEYCMSKGAHRMESFAACFAAKEAVSKALGTGISGFGMTDIEIGHNPAGAPFVTLYNGAARLADGAKVHLSLSHCRDYAMAYAVIDKD